MDGHHLLNLGSHMYWVVEMISRTRNALSQFHLERLTDLSRKVQLFVSKGPAYHYSYGRWRLRRWLHARSGRGSVMDEPALFAQLDLERAGLGAASRAIAAGDYRKAQASVAAYYRERVTPRFFFEPETLEQTLSLIDSEQRAATLCAADEICRNIFRFRQAGPVIFEDGIDWTYCPQGNADWTWDLNRHSYFETLGRAYRYTRDERYAHKFRELLLDWLANNPVGVHQPNWTSVFEVAFRLNTWIWAFYYFRTAAAFDSATCISFLKGLLSHGRYLDAHLELHAQNNHLLLEAKSLAMLGLVFPEFKLAERWRRRGLKHLYRQTIAQVCSDGTHRERATHYHRVIAGELMELLTLLENNDVSVPSDITQAFDRMVEAEMWITKPNGLIPLLGDSALKDTHLRFSATNGGPVLLRRSDSGSTAPLDEATIWLLGHSRIRQHMALPKTACRFDSRAFPEGGYFVMRDGSGTGSKYLVFDCGPFGLRSDPIHGHADALSFELYAYGQTLLLDPGVYSSHLGLDWRRFFRGSRAHNTVVVDGQDQSVLLDGRRVYRPAQTTLHQWISSEHFDFVDGSHNGYERLSEPVAHRRQVFFAKPHYWVIIDLLTGQGRHCYDLYYHLMPGTDAQIDQMSASLHAGNGIGPGLIVAPLATGRLQADITTGATAPIQGWASFHSGEKLAAPTVCYRQEAVAPVSFCTVLYPYPTRDRASAVTISTLDDEMEGASFHSENGLTNLRIQTDTHTDYLMVDRGPAGVGKAFNGYETDARLLYLRHNRQDNTLTKVAMRGGSRLLFQGRSLLDTERLVKDIRLD